MMRFGMAGSPLCSKGGLKEGVEDTRNLGLGAIEMQIKTVGATPEVSGVRELAEELDVRMSVHAPYYVDLVGSGCQQSMDNIKFAAGIADSIGASVVVTEVGLYSPKGKSHSLESAVKNIRRLRDWLGRNRVARLGIQTSGKQRVVGSVDEVLEICRRVKGVVPVLNFANIHAREGGTLKRKEDYDALFARVQKAVKGQTFYIQFSGVEHRGGDKGRNIPIRRGDLRFEPLADCLLDHPDWDVTIISSSPVMEHDALYMRVVVEKMKKRRQ